MLLSVQDRQRALRCFFLVFEVRWWDSIGQAGSLKGQESYERPCSQPQNIALVMQVLARISQGVYECPCFSAAEDR